LWIGIGGMSAKRIAISTDKAACPFSTRDKATP
jgi:hypothetical protein